MDNNLAQHRWQRTKQAAQLFNEMDIEFELSKIGILTQPHPTQQPQQLSLF